MESEAEVVNLLTCRELQGAGCVLPPQTCSSWSVAPPQLPFQDSLGLAPLLLPWSFTTSPPGPSVSLHPLYTFAPCLHPY